MAEFSELSTTQPFILSIDDPLAKRSKPQRFIGIAIIVFFACIIGTRHPSILSAAIVSLIIFFCLEFCSVTKITCEFDPLGRIAKYKTQKVVFNRFKVDFFRTKIFRYDEIVDIAVWSRTDGIFSVYMRQKKINHCIKNFGNQQEAVDFAEKLKEMVGNTSPIAEQEGKFMLYYPV